MLGANKTVTSCQSEKSSLIVQEQLSVHPYLDWASMQAYFGPGVPIPAPYFSAAVAPGHSPHPCMWNPQPMLAPFGGPLTAIYPRGAYPHPSVIHITSAMNPEVPAILKTDKEKDFVKNNKVLDKLATCIGNSNVKGAGCNENRSTESGDKEAECSTYGSGVSSGSGGSERKRNKSSEAIPNSASDAPTISLGLITSPATITRNSLNTTLSADLIPGADLRSSYVSKLKTGDEKILSTTIMEDRELKQERRKQSNRESARRSRLRRQAETEELAIKVGTLIAENSTLRSEISRLTKSSDKLKLENSALMEKLRMVQLSREENIISDSVADEEVPSIMVKNLLSRIDNCNPDSGANQMEYETYEDSSGKLHQLLDSNPKSDSLTAS
ncbi:common plant regulatory factor 1-like isoform X2 [Phalaenopsis equestris]|uniref:common plant regulatory factor 1-like isoform X2 n=1 Tax=Phalaenopsis equestris TaxID=78828 RepID=UPI0009E5034B|nr:common plant regulatory factor 1-like isoform X2 [Phalaenopsis equestris]